MDAYDVVPYGSRCYPEAHPDRLCVVARLLGRPAPDPARARVLELGCGEGGHLVPIAARLPGAVCVGIDRSEVAIARASETGRRAGARVTWIRADLREADAALARPGLPEAYDYVVAHGVYSWVPEEVRDALLALCARWLAPDGVAYVSHDTLPGGHVRRMIGEMLRFHAGGFREPERRIAQARAFLRFLAEAVPDTDPFGALLRREAAAVAARPDAWVFHDLLAEGVHPVSITDFVAHAARHGLAFLGDADLASMLLDRLPAKVRQVLEAVGEDLVRAEQYQDFVVCRGFRRTLLCRPGPIDRELGWERLLGLSARALPGLEDVSTPIEPLERALGTLRAAAPRAIPLEELAGEGAPRELVARNLLLCFARGAIALHPRPIPAAPAPGDRPEVDPLVRALADGAESVPSLLHEPVRLDGLDRMLLPACDGTRDRAGLLDAVAPVGDPMRGRIGELLEDRLVAYGHLGLLVG